MGIGHSEQNVSDECGLPINRALALRMEYEDWKGVLY